MVNLACIFSVFNDDNVAPCVPLNGTRTLRNTVIIYLFNILLYNNIILNVYIFLINLFVKFSSLYPLFLFTFELEGRKAITDKLTPIIRKQMAGILKHINISHIISVVCIETFSTAKKFELQFHFPETI